MKAARPLIIYTSDPTSPQALAWAQQQGSTDCPAVVRPLSQLSSVTMLPTTASPKS